jgi:hypothetical protein
MRPSVLFAEVLCRNYLLLLLLLLPLQLLELSELFELPELLALLFALEPPEVSSSANSTLLDVPLELELEL